jgi:hypothetical protein
MTLDDVLRQVAEEGQAWGLDSEGRIRLAHADTLVPVCPLTSLVCFPNGVRLGANAWQRAANVLDLEEDAAHDLVLAADHTLASMVAYDYPDHRLTLRRRLMTACHLSLETEAHSSASAPPGDRLREP